MGYINPLGFQLLAVKRNGVDEVEINPATKLEAGDIAILEVDEEFFHENQRSIAFSLVRRLTGARIKHYDRAVYASLITIAMVVVVALDYRTLSNFMYSTHQGDRISRWSL